MPKVGFGEEVSFGGGVFVKLKSKNDKIHFRFAGPAFYEGKHFTQNEDKTWSVTFCPRIMVKEHCSFCEKFFEFNKTIKEIKDANEKKKAESEANRYRAKIMFYYPILDRGDKRAKILQTTLSVRQAVEAEVESDIKVLEHDYVLIRNEGSPANFYSLVRKDSKDSAELDEGEQKEYERAKNFDIEEHLGHDVNESSLEVE